MSLNFLIWFCAVVNLEHIESAYNKYKIFMHQANESLTLLHD